MKSSLESGGGAANSLSASLRTATASPSLSAISSWILELLNSSALMIQFQEQETDFAHSCKGQGFKRTLFEFEGCRLKFR